MDPQIWNAISFGSVLENVVMDPATRMLDFDSDRLTENTRAAYPVDYIGNAVIPAIAGHPSNLLFLTADAFDVLPPISRLTPGNGDVSFFERLHGQTRRHRERPRQGAPANNLAFLRWIF